MNQSQESDIFVLSQCTEVEFYEPYNKITILRSHLFISLKDMFSKEDDEFDDYQANLDNNNEDRPIEPTPKRIKRMISNRNNQPELDSQISELTTLFSQAPMEFQELLALYKYINYYYFLSLSPSSPSLSPSPSASSPSYYYSYIFIVKFFLNVIIIYQMIEMIVRYY